MQDNTNKENQNKGQSNPKRNPKRKSPDWFMYIIYAIIIVTLGGLWLSGDSKKDNVEIGWSKLDQILRRGDQEKIIVVDKDHAEIFIKEEALEKDTAYKDIVKDGNKFKESGHYTYKFIDVEGFKSDLDKVAQQNFERDTAAGKADLQDVRDNISASISGGCFDTPSELKP